MIETVSGQDWSTFAVGISTGFLGAVIGGGISFATTAYFHRKSDRAKDIANAHSLTFRTMDISDRILKTKNEIDAMLEVKGGRDNCDPSEFWTAVLPIVGLPNDHFNFDPEELALLSKNGDSALAMSLLDLKSASNILKDAVLHYNELRYSLNAELERYTEFEIVDGVISGDTAFRPDERPDLVRKIGEANQLVLQIIELLEGSSAEARSAISTLNEKVPNYFNKDEFGLSLKAVN